MRWRTSSSSANETAATGAERGAAAPLALDGNGKQHDADQHHDAVSSSVTSSLLPQQDAEGTEDTSLSASVSASVSASASAFISGNARGNGNGNGYTAGHVAIPRPLTPIDPAADSSSASAPDTDGDPPYKRSQQPHRQQVRGHAASTANANNTNNTSSNSNINGTFDGNDDEDMDALPALEAVNPDDGDDDVDDDTGDDQEIPWKPQATQSTCEFTHTITNYSQKRDSGCKKAEYSATTVDEFGNRWRLIVYVNGNGRASNHHLSLFLQVADADDLPFGWKKAVSYVLTLEHPAGPNLSYAKRNPDKTFKLCPKAIDWGWSQFITSDRIQQEGFVQDDCLVVRASVTVKSSSVSIDLEDAELYLKCAVEEGKPEAVQLCLDQGASVNCQFKDDLYTPLHTACSTSTGEDDDDEEDDDDDDDEDADIRGHVGTKKNRSNSRPTASSGSMRVLQLLLDKGADGNACNKWRETPLLIAANNGHRAAVEALLKHGADPSLCSEAGWSALTFAAHKGYDDIVELLLEAGAPVNCRVTEDASTPLHKACAGSKPGHLIAVKLLLANNADVHALNKWRETPLLTAANHGQAGAVECLLKAGADPCKCTDTGWSPLSIAAYKGHDVVVRLLLEEGAPTEEADPTLSALLQAATKGLPDTVQLLLKHGADHTVTTKKGDTALSILVEQNLIDAAVDMVTEYNASIPRCSRDRKKVQRARLLINLRIKQRQKEGKDIHFVESDADEEEDDDDDNDDDNDVEKDDNPAVSTSILHVGPDEGDENMEQFDETYQLDNSKKKKKHKKKNMTAEQQAKAAEEALLLELELEDAERQKQENEASKKSAKKRKKKERERQQKKEQEEKRLAEEREREEKLRQEREAREAKERAERERHLALKRKEEEEERRRALERQKIEQQQREDFRKKELQKRKQQQESLSSNSSVSSTEKKAKQAPAKPTKRQAPSAANNTSRAATTTRPVQASKSAQAKPSGNAASTGRNAAPLSSKLTGKNRGWETKSLQSQNQDPTESKSTPPKFLDVGVPGASSYPGRHYQTSNLLSPEHESSHTPELPLPISTSSPFAFGGDGRPLVSSGSVAFALPDPVLTDRSMTSLIRNGVEIPAVALFRRSKVSELLQRCAVARNSSDPLGAIKEGTIKRVLYRWVVRAAHESTSYLDCIIPSWTDFEKLCAFFQRQFISESRKSINASSLSGSMVSIEVLKDAGSAIAAMCHNLAKEVTDFRGRVEDQLLPDWNDAVMGMKASEITQNGSVHGTSIVLDWASRAQVFLPVLTFRKLQQRYTGPSGRFLSTVFSTQIRYETQKLITDETLMDFKLPSETLSLLSLKANIQAEVWSDPMSVLSGNRFWGQFPDVDQSFGGLSPFSKDDSSDDMLVLQGGCVVTTMPLDSIVATRYMHRMLDLLDLAENSRVPLSFVIVLRSECFLDGKVNPSFHDLCLLEPRLRERSDILSCVRELSPRQHGFSKTKSDDFEQSETGSLFVIMQNLTGKNHYGLSDLVVGEILRSLAANPGFTRPDNPGLPVISEMSFSAPEFVPASNRNKELLTVGDGGNNIFHQVAGYVPSRSQGPMSPMAPATPQNSFLPDFGSSLGGDFSGFGGVPMGSAFSMQAPPSSRAPRPARGRLFDLVDDGEDETADVVSGMLGNLNMDDLFSQQPNRNSSGEIDIEAISLMGIGGPGPTSSSTASGGLQPRRGPFGY